MLGTVGRPTLSRIVNPANDVIEVRLRADLCKVRRELATNFVLAFADRVTSETSLCIEKVLAFLHITLLLLRSLAVKAGLPQVSRDRFDFVRPLLIELID